MKSSLRMFFNLYFVINLLTHLLSFWLMGHNLKRANLGQTWRQISAVFEPHLPPWTSCFITSHAYLSLLTQLIHELTTLHHPKPTWFWQAFLSPDIWTFVIQYLSMVQSLSHMWFFATLWTIGIAIKSALKSNPWRPC